ncbi:MAG: helix-turn-helix domain-containing protein [Alphaproteobacteria bacterium]|nr:helix-turn-helix domain-containing protein [Alphaproteobacteria bacterium]
MASIIERHEELWRRLDSFLALASASHKQEFVQLVAETMLELHMTQADLARYVDVSAGTVSRWLSGGNCPHRSQQRRVLSVLKRRLRRQITMERHRDALVRSIDAPKIAAAM